MRPMDADRGESSRWLKADCRSTVEFVGETVSTVDDALLKICGSSWIYEKNVATLSTGFGFQWWRCGSAS